MNLSYKNLLGGKSTCIYTAVDPLMD